MRRDQTTRAVLLVLGMALILIALGLIAWGEGAGTSRVVTTGAPPDTTVITYPGHTARGSDTLDIFLLGVGLVLVLAGIFCDRITKIGLPGGSEIDLTPTATAELAVQVKRQVGDDPHTFDRAYRKALGSLSADYWGKAASPPPDRIESAAVEAKDALESEAPEAPAPATRR
ncbi:MAG TPA: hypothetical protein VGH24_06210 [Solirubrobacteraceae bacterium]|jgi:hypothetical protein